MEQQHNEKHLYFTVLSFPEHHEVRLVDSLTGKLRERFGMYGKWWKAERAARKYQTWANAEAF